MLGTILKATTRPREGVAVARAFAVALKTLRPDRHLRGRTFWKASVPICCVMAMSWAADTTAADFASVDANEDGLIDRAEFGNGRVGDEIFKEWDRNQDGHIDRAEWRRAIQLSELESERRGQG